MNLNTFLQAVISLVFIYLILSLLTSELQEYLATFSEARAKRLKQSIRQMLGEEDWLNGYFIDGKNTKVYSQDAVIPEKSMVWLENSNGEKLIPTTKVAFDKDDDSLKSIWIDKDKNDFTGDEVVVPLSAPPKTAYKKSLTRFEVYTVGADITSLSDFYAWEKGGTLTPVKVKSNLVNNGDNTQSIWINVDQEVAPNLDPASQEGEKFPVYKSTTKIDKGAKAWKENQNIAEVSSATETFSFDNQKFIWIDTSNGNTQINSSEVVLEQPDSKEGAKINDSLQEYPLYQVLIHLKKDTKYYVNKNNQKIVPPNSLTKKLYEHPNIEALNQSAFRWFWILGISFDYPFKPWKDFKTLNDFNIVSGEFWKDFKKEDYFNLLSTALLIISVSCLFFSQILFAFIFFIFFAISRLLSFFSKGEKGKVGSRRESLGPSYIDDSELFAKTLIDVIYGNSSNIDDKNTNEGLKKTVNSLKFYTPASSQLVERLEKSANITDVGAFIADIKTQYEEVQKRSAGVYKRNAKGLSFVVGLLIAISFNADTLNIISNLTNGSNKFGEQLESQLQKNPDLIKDPTKQTELTEFFKNSDSLPLGWDYDEKIRLQQAKEQGSKNQEKILNLRTLIAALKGNEDDIRNSCNTQEKEKECFKKVENLLLDEKNFAIIPNLDDDFKNKFKEGRSIKSEKLSLFVQSYNNFLEGKEQELITLVLDTPKDDVNTTPITSLTETLKNGKAIVEQKQGGWFKASLGWLMTAIALSMGAPFWFDQLSRIMNVRNSGKPKNQE